MSQSKALSMAPRWQRPTAFNGTDTAWRVLCDLYPAAETTEIIMAVVEYCAVRHLDPFKRPVHIVPMYNTKLRRRVQVVMQGINEIETTAHRTQKFAGLDEPKWGPLRSTPFKGVAENEDGSSAPIEITVEYPEWCSVTAYRLVGNERRPFTEQLYWLESYATAGFKSTVPNARWRKAPRQMLHKCTKAAVLRLTFPEEGLGYAAEEMEDQATDTGGVTIDGKIDHGDPGLSDRDRQADAAFPPPPAPPGEATDPLEEPNGTIWLKNLGRLLDAARTLGEVIKIGAHPRVLTAINEAPTLIRRSITDMLKVAHERMAPVGEPHDEGPPDEGGPDPDGDEPPPMEQALADMMAEVDQMDAITIGGLAASAPWRKRVNDLFPLDADMLAEHIAERIAALKAPR
jgi:phage recombination protein Bet